MKNCIRVPRVLLPREGFETWAVPACDRFADETDWERVAKAVGDAPSSLRMILPYALPREDDDARIQAIRESMYLALEESKLEKLVRGCVFTERTTENGVRCGVVAAVDLEAFSAERGESALVRPSEEPDPEKVRAQIALRRVAPLEFPHAVLFFRDRKDRTMSYLREVELEELYDFDLMEGGGHLRGSYIPEELAEEIAYELHSRGEPCFAVAAGGEELAAAKLYWEEIKPTLTAPERLNHPARFALAEFVNLYDGAVTLHPVHRVLTEADTETACDFIMRNVRCKRDGSLLYPALPAGGEGAARIDELLAKYTHANGGKVSYVCGKAELKRLLERGEGLGIVTKPVEKGDFFDALKGGKFLPPHTFSLGSGSESRYHLEGRETSYD